MRTLVIVVSISAILGCKSVSGQIISTVAGNGLPSYTGDGATATAASIGYMGEMAFDSVGNYYLVENNNTIRKVSSAGIISTIAGNGTAGFSGDGGHASASQLNQPVAIVIDRSGNIFISDKNNSRIRRIDATTNIMSTFAGIGTLGFSGDGGPATAAELNHPYGICFDTSGNMYVSDYHNNRVRKINTSGIITTITGNGTLDHGGNGGLATLATVGLPTGLYANSEYLYICDGNVVRKINFSTGIISAVAGNGIAASTGDGTPATSASMHYCIAVAVNSTNELFIADMTANNIRKVDLFGIIHRVTGTGVTGFNGDGIPATTANISSPRGIAIDYCDNLYICDNGHSRIRKVTFNPPTTPTVAITGITTASVGATVTVNATVTGAGSSYTIKWMNKGVQFATSTVPTVTYTKATGIDTITARVVPAVTYCYDSTTSAPHMVSESTVGVSWLLQGDYSVYPNPGHSTLSISGGEVIKSVMITNLVGEVLINEQPDKEAIQISIANLPPGMYLLRVNARYVQRFMKE